MMNMYKSSQATTSGSLSADKSNQANSSLAKPSQGVISSSLQNILNNSSQLKNDWSDRFIVKSQSLGAASFSELGAMRFESEAAFNRQGNIHTSLIYNSHSTYYAKNTSSRNLEYLSEIGGALSDMIKSVKQLPTADSNQLAKLEYQFEDSSNVAAHFSKAAVTSFNMLENTLGLQAKDGQNLVLDSSEYMNSLLNKDYSQQEFGVMKHRATSEFFENDEAALKEADAVLNHFFSAEVFKNGELDLSTMGVSEGGLAELVNEPEKLQAFVAQFENALAKVQETIVKQGQQFKELKKAETFYDSALNQYDEGRYGPTTLASFEQQVDGYSLTDKTSFVTDFWSDQIEEKRENNLFSWLDDVETNLKQNKKFEPLDINKGTERSRAILESLAKFQEDQNLTEDQIKSHQDVIDELTKQIFSSDLDFERKEFGEANDALFDKTETLLA